MNSAPIALRLASGSTQPLQPREEALLAVHGHQRDLELVAERGDHLLALVLAHHPVVHEHAGQLVADRLVDQQRGDRAVHAARERADHLAAADLGADRRDLLVDDVGRAPVARAAADVLEERRQHLLPVGRVHDLGVELDAVEAALDVLDRGDRRLGRRRQRGEALGRRVHRVAMRHPARLGVRRPGQQAAVLGHGELRAAELADLGALDLAAQREDERLHAVTDAEHRDAELEQLRIEPRGARRVHRRRPAAQDQALRRALAHLVDADVVRQQLGEHPELAHAARDQLGVLAAVVEDDDLVGGDFALEGELLDRLVSRQRGAVPERRGLSRRQRRPLRRGHPCRWPGRAGAPCPRSAAPGRPSARRG